MSDWGVPDEPLVDPQQAAAAKEFASRYLRVFESEDGKHILAHWVRTTLLQPVVTDTGEPKADGIREGQARLVRGILTQMQFARDGQGGPIPLDLLLNAPYAPLGRVVTNRIVLAVAVVAFAVGVLVGL